MLDHFFDESGQLRPITAIEFELIDEFRGVYKWNVWSHNVLLAAEVGGPALVKKHLSYTAEFLVPYLADEFDSEDDSSISEG